MEPFKLEHEILKTVLKHVAYFYIGSQEKFVQELNQLLPPNCTAYYRDAGRRYLSLYPNQCDFDHRRADLPRNRPIQPRYSPGY